MKFPFVIAALNSRTIVFGISFLLKYHCVKSACIRKLSGPYFPARIQSECGKVRSRKALLHIVYDYFYLKKASISLPTDINFH